MHRNKIIHDLCHLAGPSCASRTISEPMVCSTQTLHLSCTNTNTISKWSEMRFHMNHVTLEFHRVRVKWFLSLLYVRHKPWTYRVSRFALSLNGPKRVSTWASSPRSTNGCIQNDIWAYGTLAQTVHLSCPNSNVVSKRSEMRFYKAHIT
jgi:hypothetical protein